jgi:hypothetical protein
MKHKVPQDLEGPQDYGHDNFLFLSPASAEVLRLVQSK